MNSRNATISKYSFVIICMLTASFTSAQKLPSRTAKQQGSQAKSITATSTQRTDETMAAKGVTGRYDLYSGIPTVYLGTLVMMDGGKYKVSFSTDENDFESGTYAYHAGSTSIEWLSGLFKRKEWGGKLIKKEAGYRIELNKSTFAEN